MGMETSFTVIIYLRLLLLRRLNQVPHTGYFGTIIVLSRYALGTVNQQIYQTSSVRRERNPRNDLIIVSIALYTVTMCDYPYVVTTHY